MLLNTAVWDKKWGTESICFSIQKKTNFDFLHQYNTNHLSLSLCFRLCFSVSVCLSKKSTFLAPPSSSIYVRECVCVRVRWHRCGQRATFGYWFSPPPHFRADYCLHFTLQAQPPVLLGRSLSALHLAVGGLTDRRAAASFQGFQGSNSAHQVCLSVQNFHLWTISLVPALYYCQWRLLCGVRVL